MLRKRSSFLDEVSDVTLREASNVVVLLKKGIKDHNETVLRMKQSIRHLRRFERDEKFSIHAKTRALIRDGCEGGHGMLDLSDRVQSAINENLFSHPPIGPIMSLISVNNPTWAYAILNAVDAETLSSFIVASESDRTVSEFRSECETYPHP